MQVIGSTTEKQLQTRLSSSINILQQIPC